MTGIPKNFLKRFKFLDFLKCLQQFSLSTGIVASHERVKMETYVILDKYINLGLTQKIILYNRYKTNRKKSWQRLKSGILVKTGKIHCLYINCIAKLLMSGSIPGGWSKECTRACRANSAWSSDSALWSRNLFKTSLNSETLSPFSFLVFWVEPIKPIID